jgi:para-aminobenzoate synthetase
MNPLPWVRPEDFFVAHLGSRPRAFWLDSGGARPWSGSTSYVGWLADTDVSLTWSAAEATVWEQRAGERRPLGRDIFAELRRRQPAGGGGAWVGWFGYSCRLDLPARVAKSAIPDACWMRMARWVAFDHATRRVTAVSARGVDAAAWRDEVAALLACTPPAPGLVAPPLPGPQRVESFDEYATAFAVVQDNLRHGNSYETNLTHRLSLWSPALPLDTYRRLRRLNPAPYAAYLTHDAASVLSSSPERYATVDSGRRIETRPIKGTTARHGDQTKDRQAAVRLRSEPKFRGENLMIVDLLRNDLSRVCQVGTVDVTNLMHVESYPTVHQLVSTIEGRLRDDVGTVDALEALFPGGSMTGAPKLRTMRLIADVETTPRGVYSGALGWIRDDGTADLGIVIRTLVHHGERYELGTGGGVTVRSRVEDEYVEAGWKAANLLRALGSA